jgi:hypothetical protein
MSRVGDRHGCISKQKGRILSPESRTDIYTVYAVRSRAGDNMVIYANRKGRMQSSESRTDLKIMQVGHGYGTAWL